MDFQQLTSVLHKSRVRKSNVLLGWIDFFSFRWVRFGSIAELNQTQSTDWVRLCSIECDWNLVRLCSIEFDWNLVRLGSICYAGNIASLLLFPPMFPPGRGGGGGGGGYSQKNWVEVCGPVPKTLTLFMTKICNFPYPIWYPIYDMTLKTIPYS